MRLEQVSNNSKDEVDGPNLALIGKVRRGGSKRDLRRARREGRRIKFFMPKEKKLESYQLIKCLRCDKHTHFLSMS